MNLNGMRDFLDVKHWRIGIKFEKRFIKNKMCIVKTGSFFRFQRGCQRGGTHCNSLEL